MDQRLTDESVAMFTPVATEGYMKETGITVEMIITDAGREMEEIRFATSATFQATLVREIEKIQKEWTKK